MGAVLDDKGQEQPCHEYCSRSGLVFEFAQAVVREHDARVREELQDHCQSFSLSCFPSIEQEVSLTWTNAVEMMTPVPNCFNTSVAHLMMGDMDHFAKSMGTIEPGSPASVESKLENHSTQSFLPMAPAASKMNTPPILMGMLYSRSTLSQVCSTVFPFSSTQCLWSMSAEKILKRKKLQVKSYSTPAWKWQLTPSVDDDSADSESATSVPSATTSTSVPSGATQYLVCLSTSAP